MKSVFAICMFMPAVLVVNAQVNLFPAYSQNFGNIDISGTWTDNSTFAGWYSNRVSINHQDVNAALPSNTGALYSYECNGNNDEKLGSRASGGTGTVRFGIRLVNNTAFTVNFIRVSFDAYQFSLADDCGTQSLTFSYLSTTPATNINAGGFTNVPALNFTALQTNGGSCGSTQLSSFPCTQTTNLSSCIAVNIPPSGEILLRWEDIDDSGNDHHMGIDNISVTAYSNNIINPSNTCISPLPVELSAFNVTCEDQTIFAEWSTESEVNNSYFFVEGSHDAINYQPLAKINGHGNSNTEQNYSAIISNIQGYIYFRLVQIDFDGTQTFYDPKYVLCQNKPVQFSATYHNNQFNFVLPQTSGKCQLIIQNLNGKELVSTYVDIENTSVSFPIESSLCEGIYIISLTDITTEQRFFTKVLVSRQ